MRLTLCKVEFFHHWIWKWEHLEWVYIDTYESIYYFKKKNHGREYYMWSASFWLFPAANKLYAFSAISSKYKLLTASLEGESSTGLCLKWSPSDAPPPDAFLLENTSTAPDNLSRISCPTICDTYSKEEHKCSRSANLLTKPKYFWSFTDWPKHKGDYLRSQLSNSWNV